MNIVDRIYLLLDSKNKTGKELAKYVGISSSTVSDWKNKKTFPSSKHISKIADFFDTTAQYLITGENLKNKYDFSEYEIELLNIYNSLDRKQQAIIFGKLYEFENDNIKELNSLDAQVKEIRIPKKQPKNIVKLPIPKTESKYKELNYFDVPVSAGLGNAFSDPDNYEVRKYELNDKTKQTDFVLKSSGDSMQPTIKDEEDIFVKSQPNVNHNEIGIFSYNGETYCKRFIKENNKIILRSDNKKYKDIVILKNDSVFCFGKVLV